MGWLRREGSEISRIEPFRISLTKKTLQLRPNRLKFPLEAPLALEKALFWDRRIWWRGFRWMRRMSGSMT